MLDRGAVVDVVVVGDDEGGHEKIDVDKGNVGEVEWVVAAVGEVVVVVVVEVEEGVAWAVEFVAAFVVAVVAAAVVVEEVAVGSTDPVASRRANPVPRPVLLWQCVRRFALEVPAAFGATQFRYLKFRG